MIFQYLQAKLQRLQYYGMLLHIVQVTEKLLAVIQIEKKTRLFAFAILQC